MKIQHQVVSLCVCQYLLIESGRRVKKFQGSIRKQYGVDAYRDRAKEEKKRESAEK